MKKIISLLTVCCYLVIASCANGQSADADTALDPATFAQKIKATPYAVILDVRTPGEFAQGHLKNAVNFNWNDTSFGGKVSKMHKQSPVFVYCLSGGRSAAAAKSLREQGFGQVYEMMGGIMKWRAADLPLETDTKVAAALGMTITDFERAIGSDKKVLVDFYAEWCGPCKQMEPYLKKIAKDKAGELTLLRIDIDANPDLAKALKIDALPVLHLYKDKKLTWSNTGYINKDDVLKKL